MAKHVVIGGNGAVGKNIVRLLEAERPDAQSGSVTAPPEVVVVSRTAGLRLDATNADALSRASEGADAIYLAAMPRYDEWPALFPPLMESTVLAAERVGAKIIAIGNVYPYGENAPSTLTEDLPSRPTTKKGRVRAEMWERALASSAPAVEVRGSDYVGDGAVSVFSLLVLPAITSGQVARSPMALDAVRPWTSVVDVARTAVAAAFHGGPAKQVFHVPSTHLSVRELASRFAPNPMLERMPLAELIAIGEHDAIAREVVEMAYLLERPWTLDARRAEGELNVRATPIRSDESRAG